MTRGGDGNRGAISNSNMMINRVWKRRVKDTNILGEVGGGATVEAHSVGDEEPMFASMPVVQHRRLCG
jgi:hypothetical protein